MSADQASAKLRGRLDQACIKMVLWALSPAPAAPFDAHAPDTQLNLTGGYATGDDSNPRRVMFLGRGLQSDKKQVSFKGKENSDQPVAAPSRSAAEHHSLQSHSEKR
jgi:hypothetical protein